MRLVSETAWGSWGITDVDEDEAQAEDGSSRFKGAYSFKISVSLRKTTTASPLIS